MRYGRMRRLPPAMPSSTTTRPPATAAALLYRLWRRRELVERRIQDCLLRRGRHRHCHAGLGLTHGGGHLLLQQLRRGRSLADHAGQRRRRQHWDLRLSQHDRTDRGLLDGNQCAGTNLGAITKIELRAYGYVQDGTRVTVGFTPVFRGRQRHDTGPSTTAARPGPHTTTLLRTRTRPSAWTWAALQGLDCRLSINRTGLQADVRATSPGSSSASPYSTGSSATVTVPAAATASAGAPTPTVTGYVPSTPALVSAPTARARERGIPAARLGPGDHRPARRQCAGPCATAPDRQGHGGDERRHRRRERPGWRQRTASGRGTAGATTASASAAAQRPRFAMVSARVERRATRPHRARTHRADRARVRRRYGGNSAGGRP